MGKTDRSGNTPPVIGNLDPNLVKQSTYFSHESSFRNEEGVTLDGFNAIMKPGEYGHVAQAIINDAELQERIEKNAEDKIAWVSQKAKNPNRASRNKLPWRDTPDGLLYKFSWNADDDQPVVYDSEGTTITDRAFRFMKVRLSSWRFRLKPCCLPGDTLGVKLVLEAIQVISVKAKAGIDAGDMGDKELSEVFGKTKGFKYEQPNVTPSVDDEDDDF